MMTFEKYIAIDWSGDKNTPTEKIQIAEYDPDNRTVSIVPSCTQSATGWNRWSREEVLGYVRRSVAGKRVLIGFDFAFGYPYCGKDEYFPGCGTKIANARSLWKQVDEFCAEDVDLYGGRFYRDNDSPFKPYYRYQGHRGGSHCDRLRITDKRAQKPAGRRPSSVFTCDYSANVGTGTLAGMRFLRRVRQQTNAAIWPFDAPLAPHGPAIVEIYPRFFLNDAENLRRNLPLPHTVRGLLQGYDTTLADTCEKWSDHERDALVSAAGMAWFANQPATWQAPTLAAKYEGWIFGVR